MQQLDEATSENTLLRAALAAAATSSHPGSSTTVQRPDGQDQPEDESLSAPQEGCASSRAAASGLRPQLINFLSPVHAGTPQGGCSMATAAGGPAEGAASAGPRGGELQVHRQQREGGRGLGLDRQLAGEGHSCALVTTPARSSRPAGVSSPEKHILDRSASAMTSAWYCALPTKLVNGAAWHVQASSREDRLTVHSSRLPRQLTNAMCCWHRPTAQQPILWQSLC